MAEPALDTKVLEQILPELDGVQLGRPGVDFLLRQGQARALGVGYDLRLSGFLKLGSRYLHGLAERREDALDENVICRFPGLRLSFSFGQLTVLFLKR